LQDLALVYVFFNVYQKIDAHNVIKKMSYIYGTVISVYLLLLLIGVRDYVYHSRIIYIMAPLVAAPMTIGTWFAFKLNDSIERRVLIPLSIFLLLLQLNDLLVFWRIFNGYYFVKIYIPFIVSMSLFIYFRRMHNDVVKHQQFNDRYKIFKNFLHDVRSPLSVLKIFISNSFDIKSERKLIVDSALDRIESMVTQVDNPSKASRLFKIPLIRTLHEVVEQKKLEYPDLKIDFFPSSEVFIFADKTQIQRILSNLINNSYESYNGDIKIVNINFDVGNCEVRIRISDLGSGIPPAILNRLMNEAFTTKNFGSGIGLHSAHEYIKNLGGGMEIISKVNHGTTVEIRLPTVLGELNNMSLEIEELKSPINDSKHADLVLIDDDKYIRRSWEFYAQSSLKNILTFSTINNFIESSDSIPRSCPIYLDLNLGSLRSTDYIDEILSLGFTNIFLATGESLEEEMIPKGIRGVSGKLPPTL